MGNDKKDMNIMVLTPSNLEVLGELIDRMNTNLTGILDEPNLSEEIRDKINRIESDVFKLGRLFCGWAE